MEPLSRARVVGIDCSSSLLGAIQTVCLPCGGGHQFCAFVVAIFFFFFGGGGFSALLSGVGGNETLRILGISLRNMFWEV